MDLLQITRGQEPAGGSSDRCHCKKWTSIHQNMLCWLSKIITIHQRSNCQKLKFNQNCGKNCKYSTSSVTRIHVLRFLICFCYGVIGSLVSHVVHQRYLMFGLTLKIHKHHMFGKYCNEKNSSSLFISVSRAFNQFVHRPRFKKIISSPHQQTRPNQRKIAEVEKWSICPSSNQGPIRIRVHRFNSCLNSHRLLWSQHSFPFFRLLDEK